MSMRDYCWRFYRFVQGRIAPSLKYSQAIYEEILFDRSVGVRRWLDLGCGHLLLPEWRTAEERRLVDQPGMFVGLDYDLPSLRKHQSAKNLVRGDIRSLPFADASVDLVTANMVFEHLEAPMELLREIRRVLVPGGVLVIHTPNRRSYVALLSRLVPRRLKLALIWFLEQRVEEDVFPTFHRFNTRQVIGTMAQTAGYSVRIRMVASEAQFIMIPPLVVAELVYIRFLLSPWGRSFRTNIVATLSKATEG